MPGLPAPLIRRLKQTLLDCGTFDDQDILKSVFVDEKIKPWKNQIPSARQASTRVDLFVSDFLDKKNSSGQSVLALFLQAVHNQSLIEEDACRQRLNDIALEVAAALRPEELPPLAGYNLWRSSAVLAGEELSGNMGSYDLPAAVEAPAPRDASLPPGMSARDFKERLESLKNKEHADWLPVSFLEKGLQAAHAVGRVEHQSRKIGTAFLVSPDLVLTNEHVVREIPSIEQAGVRFNIGLQGKPEWRYFKSVVARSPVQEYDFALVQLAAPGSGSPVTFSAETAYPNQAANILQHPAGDSLQVALRRNEVVHVDPRRVYYIADTEACSSGSPVFDDDWRVIALHRAGIVDDAQRPVKNANQGVPVTAIEPIIRTYICGG